jgi:riboflavin kinase / FMN adenylyltransferase
MDVVAGVSGLRPEHGPIFAVIGVFDGLHRGHAYLLDHLVREARARDARACVITFDHHPDEVLTGSAPPLLLDPDERIERLAAAGVEVTVVQPFDDVVRQTTYDDFIQLIRRGTDFRGLVMTPDAAFGYQRQGTPEAVGSLGERVGFDVVVIEPLVNEDGPVRSTAIRAAIERGDLADAGRLLGRPVSLRGRSDDGRITFAWPMALPPDGDYRCRLDGREAIATIAGGTVRVPAEIADGVVRLEFMT